jgi:hypothetical protein
MIDHEGGNHDSGGVATAGWSAVVLAILSVDTSRVPHFLCGYGILQPRYYSLLLTFCGHDKY